MKNVNLISRWHNGYAVPELWYMYARGGSIFITFTALCWKILQEVKISAENMRPSLEHSWGMDGVLPPITKRKQGLYTLRIGIENQIDGEKRASIANSLSYLTAVLDVMVLPDASEEREPVPGERLQLFSMETTYREGAPFHAAAMDVSISPEATEFLVAHSEEEIPGVSRAMKEHNNAMFPRDKKRGKSFFGSDLTGVIRESGTLRFVTSGNCACLGQMPQEVQKGEGLYIDSHNLDTSWQQLSMIVGVATTWWWVRSSLGYK